VVLDQAFLDLKEAWQGGAGSQFRICEFPRSILPWRIRSPSEGSGGFSTFHIDLDGAMVVEYATSISPIR